MALHTPHSLPLHGAVTLEARNVCARLAKGRGHAGFYLLWPMGPLRRADPGIHGLMALPAALCCWDKEVLGMQPLATPFPLAKRSAL